MSTNQLRVAAAAQQEPKTFLELIEVMKPEIARALPKHLNADRMARIATTEFRKNPALGKCEIRSVFGAIITLAQLGLEPGVLGQAYLIPYKGVCTAVPGWQGLADLVARAGRASVWTGAVYAGDEFDYAYGDRPHIVHRPLDADSETTPAGVLPALRYVYAVGRIKDSDWPVIEVWSYAKVVKHRDRFNKVGNQHYSFQHFEMYARKVALLQVIKYMPKAVELRQAYELNEASERGAPISVQEAVQGWVPPAEPEAGTLPSKEDALAAIRGAKTLVELQQTYGPIVEAYVAANQQVPIELETGFGDRKSALEQSTAPQK